MKQLYILLEIVVFLFFSGIIKAQNPNENSIKLSGELFSDERFLIKDKNDWAWNETRLSLNLDKKIINNSKFHSEIWLRNIGLSAITNSADLYNKGIVDPYNLDIREAYVEIYGFIVKNLDITVGRQRIVWGTADKLNPTDNLNPIDMEDILDFGRRRGSDAINLKYYLNSDLSIQGVFIPFFQPANMPIGIFSNSLNTPMDLPSTMTITGISDTILMPGYNFEESSAAGFKLKGFVKGVDFSISYAYGLDGLPINTRNTFVPVNLMKGEFNINSQLSFARSHIFGLDMATGIGGVGLWAEAALFKPDKDVVMINDFSAIPVITEPLQDSLILEKSNPYLKFIVGGDYFFADGSYFNIQYMHGFIHERGKENLNDYFFLQYEMKFFNEKLNIAPIGGGFIVADWDKIIDNYALIYMPELTYQATTNTEIRLSVVLFDGKGENIFANLNNFNMFIFKLKYSF